MASNETVVEIVREMREAGRPPKVGACESPDDYVVVHKFVIEWADRIEAAHEREILVERHLADEYFAAKDDERLTIVANYENVIKDLVRNISAKDAEIAGLRELLIELANAANTAFDDIAKCGSIIADGDVRDAAYRTHLMERIAKYRKALKGGHQ